MQSTARDALTPDTLSMLQVIAETGSFAAAARQLGLVPSALTYRVRQVEEALDVLLFDRSARQARPTEAGSELLREGTRLLEEMEAVAHRVRRVATGWEPQLTIAVDGVISPTTMLELVEAFYAQSPPTRLKLREDILSGTLEALTSGRADLALGVAVNACNAPGLQGAVMGDLLFIFTVAPHHPLATAPEPLTDSVLRQHRAIAVADTAQRGGMTMGLLGGQDVLTVDSMQTKLQAQLRGLGGGFLPEPMVRAYVEAGRLVTRQVARPARRVPLHYAWRGTGHAPPGRALQWWLQQLESPATRKALLENHHIF
ncbi:DNA-binding transcriptional LysR family regulator [Paracidovorax anthurii]|uniref:DNA-binding transcriptional LysR family regulator n=1 Tax=Paracidovorax anthurii TaxID=78229 RepID=A0A328Z8U4_9BURK|nr:LysR family transcriptional regulator [Paracidovorax anthurii]RAR82620.1 DNA-binding transcriptional LysR family regulator [Paracidovorax anthurii]